MAVLGYPSQPVLIVDDEAEAADECRFTLRAGGITNAVCCHDSREVLPLIKERPFSVMLLDLWMPHANGQSILAEAAHACPELPVIVVTGANDVETAVQCMKLGARDYMVKPVEASRMISGVQRVIELREVETEYQSFRERVFRPDVEHPEAFAEIITHDPAMHVLFKYVETIARTRKPVLVTGETGVGKELVAKAVHRLSSRPGPFVALNVAAVDDLTFSDTLFGHLKGAFTDAHAARDGLIRQAADGTLFLDEMGDLSPASQAKLLRLVQEGEYFPLGSDVPRRSNARLVAATNQYLEQKVTEGRFRSDLYHRLRAHHVHIPPLRARLGDIPFLVDYLLEQSANELGVPKPSVFPELFPLLAAYDFPGNIRELEHIVFEALSTHRSGRLSLGTFRALIKRAPDASPPDTSCVDAVESLFAQCRVLPSMTNVRQALIDEALRRAQGNQSIAAGLIGVSQSGISRRIKRSP